MSGAGPGEGGGGSCVAAQPLEVSRLCPAGAARRHSKALAEQRLLEARVSGPRLCVDLGMADRMSLKVRGRRPPPLGPARLRPRRGSREEAAPGRQQRERARRDGSYAQGACTPGALLG